MFSKAAPASNKWTGFGFPFNANTLCVTITTVTGVDETEARAGPIFWYEDVNNFYVFEIAPNGRASV